MNSRTREHIAYARNLLRDALQLSQGRAPACAPRRDELAATYRSLLQASDEIAHALAYMQVHDRDAVLDALSPSRRSSPSEGGAHVFSTRAQRARLEAATGRPLPEDRPCLDKICLDTAAPVPPTVHEVPEPFRGIETPRPSPVAFRPSPRAPGLYTWDHRSRQLIAAGGTLHLTRRPA